MCIKGVNFVMIADFNTYTIVIGVHQRVKFSHDCRFQIQSVQSNSVAGPEGRGGRGPQALPEDCAAVRPPGPGQDHPGPHHRPARGVQRGRTQRQR